jgi:hypothetical protein
MKKLLMIATVALLSTGAAFACDGEKKECKKGEKKECCKKSDKKDCCKKDKKATTAKPTA